MTELLATYPEGNPWPTGSPEWEEFESIVARLADPGRERRAARYAFDRTAESNWRDRQARLERYTVERAKIAPTGVLFGPDCSQFQGKPDWTKVRAAGCDIGGYKVSEGMTYEDPSHQYNKGAVPKAGLVPLAYHYMSPTSPADRQADWYIAHADPDAIHALDVEAAMAAPGLDVSTWVARYRSHYPHKPLRIYSNRGMWLNRSHVSDHWPSGVGVWHAGIGDGFYTSATGALWTEWVAASSLSNSMASLGAPSCQLWQFTDHAVVPGVAGTCDGNGFQGSRAELEALVTGDDVPLTDAEMTTIASRAADAVWAKAITSLWSGGAVSAAAMLAHTEQFACEAGWPMNRPSGSKTPNTPTYAATVAAALKVVTGQTDTLEASNTVEASELAKLVQFTTNFSADILAQSIVDKLGSSPDAAAVKAAVASALQENLPTFDIVASKPATPPTS